LSARTTSLQIAFVVEGRMTILQRWIVAVRSWHDFVELSFEGC